MAAAERTLGAAVDAPGVLEALGRTVLQGELVAGATVRLRGYEVDGSSDLESTNLGLYLGEGLLASERHHRYPQIPPQTQEVVPQA